MGGPACLWPTLAAALCADKMAPDEVRSMVIPAGTLEKAHHRRAQPCAPTSACCCLCHLVKISRG